MPDQKVNQPVDKILISLDSLLDTRLGVIAQHYPDKMEKLLTKLDYFERLQDRFKGINPEQFAAHYKNRNVDTLKNSLMTNMTLLMGSFVKSAAKDVLSSGPQTNLIFDINIHPYQLDEEEKQDLLGVLEFHVGDAPEYNIVSIPNEFLTPQICKDQYSVLVLYDFAEWMRMHAPAFKEARMPNMVVYAPRLLEKLPTAEENKLLMEAQLDPFEASRIAASPAFTLRFLTVDMYCVRDAAQDAKRTQMRALMEQVDKEQPTA